MEAVLVVAAYSGASKGVSAEASKGVSAEASVEVVAVLAAVLVGRSIGHLVRCRYSFMYPLVRICVCM